MFICILAYAIINLFKEKQFDADIVYIPFAIVELLMLDFPVFMLIKEVLK
jgi:hypothetical protein